MYPAFSEIPENYKITALHQNYYLMNGEIKKWNGPQQQVLSPILIKEGDETNPFLLGSYPLMNSEAALNILNAAVNAYNNGRGVWPTMRVKDRIQHILLFTKKMKEKRTEMVNWLMWEIGKSLSDSQKEFDRTIDYIIDTIEALKNLDRDAARLKKEGGIYAQIRRGPLGVVLCMGPYNYPLNETFTTLIPALIMGNTVVFKPAKYGVLLIHPLLELFRDCFPAGVINTVYGSGTETIGPIMQTGKIDVLAFIGSSKSGHAIKKQHPKINRLRSVLGLDAKNPAIIMENADLVNAVDECVSGSLSYNGQRCTAIKIIFVHKKLSEEFRKQFVAKVSKLKWGMPWENEVNITPLPEIDKTKFLKELLDDAISKGAKLENENGGSVNGNFFSPAVVFGVNDSMRLFHEEQFGPIVPICEFDDVNVPIDYMVNSNFGQQVSIFSTLHHDVAALIDPLVNQVCRVNINSQCQRGPDSYPFNGRKDSAEGTLSVSDALRVFSIRTMVAAKDNDLNKAILGTIIDNKSSHFLNTDYLL